MEGIEKQDYLHDENAHYQEMIDNHGDSLEKIIDNILESGKDSEYFLGEGDAAQVHILGSRTPKRAIKIIKRDAMAPGAKMFAMNDIHVETEIADAAYMLANKIKANIEIPEQKLSITQKRADGTKMQFSIMEAMNAVSIKDIIERGADLPEKFNREVFFAALEDFIKKMNAAGIHHRDLHTGNIMINKETGMPVVIDFGLSVMNHPGDPYEFDESFTHASFSKDEDMVIKAQGAITKYLVSRMK